MFLQIKQLSHHYFGLEISDQSQTNFLYLYTNSQAIYLASWVLNLRTYLYKYKINPKIHLTANFRILYFYILCKDINIHVLSNNNLEKLMNKWSLVFLVLCVFGVYTQQGDATAEDQQYASMRRTACLVLSRYHSNTQKDTIQSVVQGLNPEMQQVYINKLYSNAVETCEPLINQSEVQELFVQNPEFDPTHLFHLFETVDYAGIADNLDSPLTPNQQNIVKFMKKFDQQMAIRKQQKQAQKSPEGLGEQNDIKILGISFSKMSSFSKLVYVSIFVSIIVAFLFYGFKKIDTKPEKKTKKKKSPKKQ